MHNAHNLMSAILIVIGIALIVIPVWTYIRVLKTHTWERVSAKFDDPKLYERREPDFRGWIVYYCASVSYSYTYMQNGFTNSRAYIDDKSACGLNKSDAENLARILAKAHNVYVNPRRPSESVVLLGLSKYRKSHYLALMLAGSVLMSGGLVLYS